MKAIYITIGFIVVMVIGLLLLTFMLGGMFCDPVIVEFDDE